MSPLQASQLPFRTVASTKALMEIKDVTEEDAKAIRALWRTERLRNAARSGVDRILRTHGVEYLGINKRTKAEVYYCNAGDTYATTVLFVGPHLRVGCWGDLVERGTVATAPGY